MCTTSMFMHVAAHTFAGVVSLYSAEVPIYRVWLIKLMMTVLGILSCSYLASSLVNILCLLLEF
jgi:hypothetical protein